MTNYTEIKGDLVKLTLEGKFDVIAHGCNCFCTMGAGIAVAMKNAFSCDRFPMEDSKTKGDYNKLGQIDFVNFTFTGTNQIRWSNPNDLHVGDIAFAVVNCYTQYHYGRNHADGVAKPFDETAFRLCMRKMNKIFEGMHIGLPQIGAGLAGGNWNVIKSIIQEELCDCKVTVVIFDKN